MPVAHNPPTFRTWPRITGSHLAAAHADPTTRSDPQPPPGGGHTTLGLSSLQSSKLLPTLSDILCRIVFSGTLTGEYDEEETQRRFAASFNLDTQRLQRLFSGKEFDLKSNISESRAMDYAFKIA